MASQIDTLFASSDDEDWAYQLTPVPEPTAETRGRGVSEFHGYAKLQRVAVSSLQKYADEPPGEGRGVIYAAVNTVNGMMYVGKHIHGATGKSVSSTRWKSHATDPGCRRFYNALHSYGLGAFEWHIIENVPEDLVLEYEQYWISSQGLDTLSPRGYNLVAAAASGGASEETRRAMSRASTKRYEDPEERDKARVRAIVSQNKPETREKISNAKLRKRQSWYDNCDTEEDAAKLQKKIKYLDKLNEQHRLNKDEGRPKLPIGSVEKRDRRQELALSKRNERLAACVDDRSKEKLLAHFAKLDRNNAYRARKAGYSAMV